MIRKMKGQVIVKPSFAIVLPWTVNMIVTGHWLSYWVLRDGFQFRKTVLIHHSCEKKKGKKKKVCIQF